MTAATSILARAAVLVDNLALVCRARGYRNVFLPGGHLEADEGLVTALRRELDEELGLACANVEPIGVVENGWDDDAGAHMEINHVFRVDIASIGPEKAPASREEQLTFSWVHLDDLDDVNLLPAPMRPLLRLTAGGFRGAFFESTLAVDRSRVVVRRVQPSDVDHLRHARLYALAETPTAFGATLARDLGLPRERWLSWANNDGVTADTDGRVKMTVVATDGDAIRGIALGVRGERCELNAMWVHPSFRGGGESGIAAQLVHDVVEWARTAGERSIALYVSSANPHARRFYEQLGFVPTGEIGPLPSRPTLTEERLVRALS